MLPLLVTAVLVAQAADPLPASHIEGRPPLAQASPLQTRIDAAPAGSTIDVAAGTYTGDLFIDRPLKLLGHGRPKLVGSGNGSVVRVRAADVVIEGFDIDGRIGGSLARDSSGIHVAAPRVTIRDCHIERSLFGIYLLESNDATLEHNVVTGLADREPGDQGSGIHIFNSTGFTLLGNQVRYSRDGIYLQSASQGRIAGNSIADVRYGLHYMYSDDNLFEDNSFERNAAGGAVMYSKRIIFRRNRFVNNRGFASVGILIQACEDIVAEDNRIENNARGLFLEGTHRNTFRRNLISTSDTALVLYDSAIDSRFEGNAFVGNLTPLQLVGRRSDAQFDRNYWSEADEPDLDGDGVRDRPYRLSNVFDHLRGNLTAADLFAQGLGAGMLAAAEQAFPVLKAVSIEDAHPLVRVPDLRGVPARSEHGTTTTPWALGVSAASVAAGLLVLAGGRRRRPHGGRVFRPGSRS